MDIEKQKKLTVAAATGVLVIVVGLGIGAYMVKQHHNNQQETPAVEKVEPALVPVTLQFDSDKFVEGTSPIIVHTTSKDGTIDYYHAITPGSDEKARMTQSIDLPRGELTFEFIPAVTSDGGILKSTTVNATVGGDDTHKAVKVETTTVDPKDVTVEDLQNIADETKKAIESGHVDDTLTGEAATKVTEELTKNISANDSLSKDETEKVAKTTETIKPVAKPKENTKIPTAPAVVVSSGSSSSHSSSGTSTVSHTTAPATRSSEPAVNSKPSESPKTSEPAKPNEPQKKRVWVVDHKSYTEKKLVKAAWDEKILVEPAHYEDIYARRVVDNYSGKYFTSVEDWVAFSSKLMQEGKINECQGYSTKRVVVDRKWIPDQYKTVHHDAVYNEIFHPEEGHYEWVTP